jgi:hypothetical protein
MEEPAVVLPSPPRRGWTRASLRVVEALATPHHIYRYLVSPLVTGLVPAIRAVAGKGSRGAATSPRS